MNHILDEAGLASTLATSVFPNIARGNSILFLGAGGDGYEVQEILESGAHGSS